MALSDKQKKEIFIKAFTDAKAGKPSLFNRKPERKPEKGAPPKKPEPPKK